MIGSGMPTNHRSAPLPKPMSSSRVVLEIQYSGNSKVPALQPLPPPQVSGCKLAHRAYASGAKQFNARGIRTARGAQ